MPKQCSAEKPNLVCTLVQKCIKLDLVEQEKDLLDEECLKTAASNVNIFVYFCLTFSKFSS